MIRQVKLAVLMVICAALASLAPADIAQAASVTPQQLYDLRAELPYVHTDIAGRRWIYGAASTNNSGYRDMRSFITQNFGGRWNVVGTSGAASGAFTQRAIGQVLCTGGQTDYQFRTVGQVSYGGRWHSVYSAPKTMKC